ncbi:hydrogen gas-evolving membrane-bound hydrogenase subunit E [Allonocardiopsis opalescens]|uniref:Multicomponent Na+:H+ antiporter subunit A n=1 Tax=Allonocardiopsis opalescens TaxID=1144618 RepID=A0A2T0Q0L9_9ACTN|nr:hydrogen gas-evolving membrane-bound hydrogenase subunit E [Allonocardiopsis opalescens]PRX97342.1 multicomponent Na+:H+ antiporter subunit A [Allonocardiopsis opalescens]
MLPALIALHVAVAVVLPPLAVRLGPRVFLVAAVPLLATAGWALLQLPGILDGRPATASVPWAPELGLVLDFRLDALALTMVALISGIGSLIFVYAAWYFSASERALGRLAAMMVLFSASMLGVVVTDNLLALYVFWELTTVCSFVLIGHSDHRENSRRAAIQALITTAGFGLLMLIGFLLLGQAAGTYRISELVADPPTGPLVPLAVVLVLAGAFAKSAQVPLHYWLPAAMVAPTPVSAYLHAATMVKGGVYLVARLAPGFADTGPWLPLVLSFGLATMVVGAWRAMRQDDGKLLLAYGTVSQLGFLTVLAGAGTPISGIAVVAMLLAHGFFKSTLFLAVGVIDHQVGTRTMSRLSGVGRRMPVLATAAAVAAGSMAGLPPLLGFVAKEADFEVYLPGHHPALSVAGSSAVLLVLALGSVLTFGYSARLWWGSFTTKAEVAERRYPSAGPAFLAPVVLLAAACLLPGLAPSLVDPLAQAHAATMPHAAAPDYHLALWHGFSLPLLLSVAVTAAGLVLFANRERFYRLQSAAPRWPDAEVAYHLFVHAVYSTALGVTRRLQTGSLPLYLTVILGTLLVVPGGWFVWSLASSGLHVPMSGGDWRLWDTPVQLVLALVVGVSAIAAVREERRFPALLLLGATGFGMCGIFVVHGAPDLALTLILVETLTMIILIFVLRRLPARFASGARRVGWPRRLTAVVCALAGIFVAGVLAASTYARSLPPASVGYWEEAEHAGSANLVNLILADFRAMDTIGEITVLVTAAVAVASLVVANRRTGGENGGDEGNGAAKPVMARNEPVIGREGHETSTGGGHGSG